MQRDTDRDWSLVSEENPYWGVLSQDEFLNENLDSDAMERFFESGHQYVDSLMRKIHRYFGRDFRIGRALDFGCGVGRIAFPLASVAEEVVGVDVAPRMLELFEQHREERNLSQVSAVMGDDGLTNVEGQFDLVTTYIVLQHIEPDRGYQIISKLVDHLNPGGVAALHMTYGKSRTFWKHEAGRAQFYRREGAYIKDLLSGEDARPSGSITMYDYDLNQVFALLIRQVRGPIFSSQTNHDGHLGIQLLFQKR